MQIEVPSNAFLLMLQGSSSLGFERGVCSKFVGCVLAFVDPVMHCALVIVILQYGHCKKWRNVIVIQAISLMLKTMPTMQNIYMHRRHYYTATLLGAV